MENKYTLILLKDKHILVSDEDIQNGDYIINLLFINDDDCIHQLRDAHINLIREINKVKHSKKIIAGINQLPTLTYSDEVKQILRDKYGWIDVEELAETKYGTEIESYRGGEPFDQQKDRKNGFIEGFKAHQFITNKMFSLDDIKNALNQMCNVINNGYVRKLDINFQQADDIIQSLQQPIQLDVEVEMEDIIMDNGNKDNYTIFKPKITNNSIKITKLCK